MKYDESFPKFSKAFKSTMESKGKVKMKTGEMENDNGENSIVVNQKKKQFDYTKLSQNLKGKEVRGNLEENKSPCFDEKQTKIHSVKHPSDLDIIQMNKDWKDIPQDEFLVRNSKKKFSKGMKNKYEFKEGDTIKGKNNHPPSKPSNVESHPELMTGFATINTGKGRNEVPKNEQNRTAVSDNNVKNEIHNIEEVLEKEVGMHHEETFPQSSASEKQTLRKVSLDNLSNYFSETEIKVTNPNHCEPKNIMTNYKINENTDMMNNEPMILYYTNNEKPLMLESVIDGMEHINKDSTSQFFESESISTSYLKKIETVTLSEVFSLANSKSKSKSPMKMIKPKPDKNLSTVFSTEDIDSVSQPIGKTIVSDWERAKLLKWPMLIFCYHLKLNDRNLHTPLEFNLREESYNLLFHGWKSSQKKLEKLEIECKNFLDDFEFTRRLFAFRHLLHRRTMALSWAHWKETCGISSEDLNIFENIVGLSDDYLKIKKLPKFLGVRLKLYYFHWDKVHPNLNVKDILETSLGKSEALQRQELHRYLISRIYSNKWWNTHNLEKESVEYGIDILVVLKIGDALQLGSKEYSEERGSLGRLYRQLISIMTDITRPLKWIESPERAWFYRNHGDEYQKRLLELQRLVFIKAEENRTSIINTIQPALKISTLILESKTYKLGHELIWCDLGLQLEHLVKFWIARNHEGDPDRMNKFSEILNELSSKEINSLKTWHLRYILSPISEKSILLRGIHLCEDKIKAFFYKYVY
ncbi:hypothetical protein PGT21_024302 [Puccinia graminis f. sp. tritici]|uniref:Uncharacterized protein n=1 Tax=Puccinia graminis f. sp. tritici TaxID=56615 RepID=A0A5B0N505_PUCGR|nr:hypothetical protein PGT21_024302 [Puccinia graminis f. sp. tritici]